MRALTLSVFRMRGEMLLNVIARQSTILISFNNSKSGTFLASPRTHNVNYLHPFTVFMHVGCDICIRIKAQ